MWLEIPSMSSDIWPTFAERYGEMSRDLVPAYGEGVVVAVLISLFLTALFALFSPGVRNAKILAVLTLRVGDNTKGKGENVSGMTQTFFLLQGAFLFSLLIEALYADRGGGLAPDVKTYWVRIAIILGTVIALFAVSSLVYMWIGAVFGAKEENKVWKVSYLTLLMLWSTYLFIPVVLLVISKSSVLAAISVALVGYLLFRTVLFIRIVQIFKFSYHHPLHLFLYLCGREIAPLLLVLGATL
ncbi:DUF4271 domain-containing protein [Porphyromonas sp.]|uniref:DUF4271 domain-containing protein n=1 Tax=Porphyromonas sp. TaxID=1924944 RepID=UPI0026DC1623|nr:DUF4271 domain-containing protein [Porphyromonas sp.]MDO4695800.1 DUF4271 domain-containing protein [Porphyromonas sp.]MDO4771794.1 DUF4271 domain-containing protein [Porphyromonas sp.]